MSSQDLWPEDIADNSGFIPPVTILKEQASAIGRRTNNIVVGEVKSRQEGKNFVHEFFLVAPALDNYRYRLLYISHPIEFYPLHIETDAFPGQVIAAGGVEEFKQRLTVIFANDKTKRVIKALITQSS